MDEEAPQKQRRNKGWDNILPHQFKPGQSGNPGGRPKGESMKAYAQRLLAAMTEEERQEYLKGIPKDKIWEMAEGKPKQDMEVSGEMTTKIIQIDE